MNTILKAATRGVFAAGLFAAHVAIAQEAPPADATKPPATTAAEAPGGLEVACDVPGLEVKIDGNSVGRTPLRVGSLTPGTHKVELTQLDGQPLVKEVAVQSGMVARWEAVVAGGAVIGPSDMNAPVAVKEAAPVETKKSALPLSFGKYVFWALEPFAWAAAVLTGVALLTTAVTLVLVRGSVPIIGPQLAAIGDLPWRGVQLGAALTTLILGAITIALFVFPTLPLVQTVLGKREDAAPSAS